MSKLTEVDGSDLGIVIDGSHWSSTDFDIAVIDFAIGFGYQLDMQEWADAKQDWQDKNDLTDWEFSDLTQGVWEECELAIQWMNDQVPENYYFFVDDGSLYLTYEEEGHCD